MRECAGCGSNDLSLALSLGSMPPVNSFVRPNQAAAEISYPLDLYFCRSCSLAQLGNAVDPSVLFSDYSHLSSASASNLSHLKTVAGHLSQLGPQAERVLEIGANDGSLLNFLKLPGRYLLAVDPAENLRPRIEALGIAAKTAFFNERFAADLASTEPPFSLIIAINVVAHTPGFVSLFRGVKSLLAPGGLFYFEVAYVLDTVLKGQFDTIYHEHVYCFSLNSLRQALERTGLRAVSAEIIPTQGHSLRVIARNAAEEPLVDPSVAEITEQEVSSGCTSVEAFTAAGNSTKNFSSRLRSAVGKVKDEFGPLIGLGAPARGVVILNYCGLGTDHLSVLIDDTPLKQGLLAPGVHIPVSGWDAVPREQPAGYLLLSWNYKAEILKKLRAAGGRGKMIIPFPELQEIEL